MNCIRHPFFSKSLPDEACVSVGNAYSKGPPADQSAEIGLKNPVSPNPP